MFRNIKLFILTALLLLTPKIFGDSAYENLIVNDIQVIMENQNIEEFDSNAILSKLKTQKGSYFSESSFDEDLKILSKDFERIEPVFNIENEKLNIILKLWAMPIISSIEWNGNELIKTKKLNSELGIEINSKFNRAEFNKALNKVKEFYIKKGFFESQITYKVFPVSDKNLVRIVLSVKEGKHGRIKDIELIGFTKDEKSEIYNLMATKKYVLILSLLDNTGTYREDAIEQDRMSIINFLQNKGYADAKVDIKIIEDNVAKKVILEITAHRGTLYRVGKITFDGNTILSNEEIMKHFTIYPDDAFSPEKIRETAEAIKEAYGTQGYIETNVYHETFLMENEPVYNVNFYINESGKSKIGLIKIFGNTSTKTSVILRHSLLVPGETFDSRKIKATQSRLENLGFFKSVNVYSVQSSDPDLGPSYRDVHIEVEETSTGHLSFSAGYSSNDSVTGTIDISENNFDHAGLYRVFKEGPSAFRGAGEYTQLKGSFGKKQKNASLNWMTPYFRDSLWRFGFEVSGTFSKLQAKDYKLRTVGGSLFGSYPISTFWSVGSRYRLRKSDNIVRNKALLNPDESEVNRIINEAQANSEGLISGVALYLNYDSTDNTYKAHRGFRSTLDAEYVGLGGKYQFWKYSYVNSYYYPLWKKGTIKYKWDFKFIDTIGHLDFDKVPLSERFFLGGDSSVRGYKPFIIGPKMPGKPNDPLGGTSSMLLSIEYNQTIIKPLLDMFIFLDGGSVAFKDFTVHKPRLSTGIGARLEIMPRTPITVGWGYPLNKKNHKDRQSLFFQMGGQF